jgi:hypothetical protein
MTCVTLCDEGTAILTGRLRYIVLCRFLEKLPPRSSGALGTVSGGISCAAEVPELLLTMDGSEASVNGGGWVPPLPTVSQVSLKQR